MKLCIYFWILISIGSTLGCSANILEAFSDTQTDEALLFAAKKKINSGDYDTALTYFSSMTSSFRSRRDVIAVQASAYAGKGGLNFLDLVDGLTNMGTNRLFVFLMQTFTSGTTTKRDSCITAEALMQTISSSYASRTSDENLFLSLINLAKMGVIFNRVADANADNSVDGGFSACSSASISDADVGEIGTAINLMRTSLSGVSGTTFGSFASDINTICANWPAMVSAYNFCVDGLGAPIFTSSSFTANQLKGIRSLINENSTVGLGSCAGDIVACACP